MIGIECNNYSIESQHKGSPKSHLSEGRREIAIKEYLKAESEMDAEIEKILSYYADLLVKLDFEFIKERSIKNFNILTLELRAYNSLDVSEAITEVPFAYPFLSKNKLQREQLISKNKFFSWLWPNVLEESIKWFSFEKKLAQDMFPLPIDHRWNEQDMNYIVSIIKREI